MIRLTTAVAPQWVALAGSCRRHGLYSVLPPSRGGSRWFLPSAWTLFGASAIKWVALAGSCRRHGLYSVLPPSRGGSRWFLPSAWTLFGASAIKGWLSLVLAVGMDSIRCFRHQVVLAVGMDSIRCFRHQVVLAVGMDSIRCFRHQVGGSRWFLPSAWTLFGASAIK